MLYSIAIGLEHFVLDTILLKSKEVIILIHLNYQLTKEKLPSDKDPNKAMGLGEPKKATKKEKEPKEPDDLTNTIRFPKKTPPLAQLKQTSMMIQTSMIIKLNQKNQQKRDPQTNSKEKQNKAT